MQRFGACFGVGAMFLILLTTPLFHFHDRDDHGNPASVLHAHFLESVEAESHSDEEVEAPHSHNNVRWIDFFACKAPSASFDLAIEFSGKLSGISLEECTQVTIASIPQAHGPPGVSRPSPRSPPSV